MAEPSRLGLVLALSLSAFCAGPAFASPVPTSVITRSIVSDLQHRKSVSFASLLSDWEKHYGTQVVPSLLQVARNRASADPERYVALMGVAKIAGRESAPLLSPFLSDSSWMLRNGALRALSALENPKTASAVLPLLKDPALVVRLEAVQAVERLCPAGATEALLQAIVDPQNYHHGKAQWIPQRALAALAHLKSRGILDEADSRLASSRLTAMLDHPIDPGFKPKLAAALREFNP